ncbi:MAG: DUF503 domain-containing protein [Clostridiaceae bacterium]|jgi:uncharacterized protein YlxP (DUF503 family)|nr:DUF503 domain-containing protein [Clostridiaceae bacterium]
MVIGIMKVRLFSSDPQSLKDKRRLVRSLVERIKNRFNVSVAETGAHDSWNHCEIGIACVSNESAHADSMLAAVANYIESDGWLEITDYSTELIHIEQ